MMSALPRKYALFVDHIKDIDVELLRRVNGEKLKHGARGECVRAENKTDR